MRDFNISGYSSVLTSTAFIEGFGVGSYSKLDTIAYQGLATSITQSKLPYVLPRYQYSYFGEPDALGGRLRFDTEDFNVVPRERHQHAARERQPGLAAPVRRRSRRIVQYPVARRLCCIHGHQP